MPSYIWHTYVGMDSRNFEEHNLLHVLLIEDYGKTQAAICDHPRMLTNSTLIWCCTDAKSTHSLCLHVPSDPHIIHTHRS